MNFTVTSSGLKLSCNRCGLPFCNYSLTNDFSDNVPIRNRKKINILKCGCVFAIVVSYVVPTFPDPNNKFGPCLQYAIDWHTEDLKEVKISSASCYDHTNGFQPSYQQSVMQQWSAGTLFEKESYLMDHLLQIMEMSNKHLHNDHLRAELKLLNPSQLHITSIQLYNFCLWATKEIECQKQPGFDKKLLKKSDLDSMLCDQASSKPAANDAVAHANDLYCSVLNYTMASSNNSWKVDAYLQKLKDGNDCFDYLIARDAATRVPTAVVWQTVTNWSDLS
jgi:hypothetical protein